MTSPDFCQLVVVAVTPEWPSGPGRWAGALGRRSPEDSLGFGPLPAVVRNPGVPFPPPRGMSSLRLFAASVCQEGNGLTVLALT